MNVPARLGLRANARQFGLPAFSVTVKKDPAWGNPMNAGKPGGEVTLDLEVAHAIAWLLSPMSSGVTGINLPVDAGYIAGTTWAAYGGLREAPGA